MEIVLHQTNVYVKLDGEVQFVMNVQMDIIQVMRDAWSVAIVVMEFARMDQMEMVHVHVIQVIQHLRVQLITVLFVLLVMS